MMNIFKRFRKKSESLKDSQKAFICNIVLQNYDLATKMAEFIEIVALMSNDFSKQGLGREALRMLLNNRISRMKNTFSMIDEYLKNSNQNAPIVFSLLKPDLFEKAFVHLEAKTKEQRIENGEAILNAIKMFVESENEKAIKMRKSKD